MRPRPYLSYSQTVLIESNPKGYVEDYIYGRPKRSSRGMAYGSKFADSLENDEDTGDLVLDLVTATIPRFEIMDVEFMTEIPGMEPVPLLIKMDTRTEAIDAFKEYKTGKTNWTQKMADDSAQITFYATGAWLKTGKIPQDIELIHMPTTYDEDGIPHLTGEIRRFKTTRNMADVLRMIVRAKKAWEKIETVCNAELL